MRAITIERYGRPTAVLRESHVDAPPVADDAVLVRVRAASLNPADWHLVRGIPYAARLQIGLRRPPFRVPGSDVAGVVEAVGAGVRMVQPGDEVFGTTFLAGFGAFAEQVAVPARLLARKPAGVSFENAAAVPLAGSTALQALRDHGHVEPGQHVLVVGASGGVGGYAVQVATHLGASVTGVCSTGNVDLVRSLGADRVVDYTAEDVTAGAARYDVILQAGGMHPASQLARLLTPTGTLVQISGDSPNRWVGPLGRIVAGRLRSRRSGRKITTFTVQPNAADLDVLAGLLETGTARSTVERTVALAEVGAALERLEAGHTRGKVVVTP